MDGERAAKGAGMAPPRAGAVAAHWRASRDLRLGSAIVLPFIVMGLLAGWLAPYDPMAIDLGRAFRPPGWPHLLGTDNFGRDLFSRILFGARYSLLTGCVAVGVALAASLPLGLSAGYFGGWWDGLLMRLVDVLLAFPTILLAIAIVTVVGPNLQNAMLAVGVASVPVFARLIRSAVLVVKQQGYVEAARALGARGWRIALRHVLPNCLAVLVVQSSLRIGTAILTGAGLSFLGLGAQPPLPEWGAMVNQGKDFLHQSLPMSVFPGLAIMLVVLGFNLFGDGLNKVLNPRLRE